MFLPRRPTTPTLQRLVAQAQGLPLTYSPIGLARLENVRGFRADDAGVVLGHGSGLFERARQLMREWRQFDLGWAGMYPMDAALREGTTLAVFARHLGFWSVHCCRIVYLLDASDAPGGEVFGFAYGTLAEHAETGEEIFQVAIDPTTAAVTYSIRAVSRERAWLARLGAPIARQYQARFRRDSLDAMQRHLAAASRSRDDGDRHRRPPNAR